MISDLLKSIIQNETFKRIDFNHPYNFQIGLNEIGLVSFEFRGNFKEISIKGTSNLSIEYKYNDLLRIKVLRIVLLNNEYKDIFISFVNDLCEKTSNMKTDDQTLKVISKRLNVWKYFFKNVSKETLGEKEIMGLIGELLYLKCEMKSAVGYTRALLSWSGYNKTHKDFSLGDKWYEIKTKTVSNNNIQVSSLEQLEGDGGYLIVYELEKMSSTYSGINLNNLVLQIISEIETYDDQVLFCSQLSELKYKYNILYDSLNYNITSVRAYRIENDFPMLTKKTVPLGVVATKYKLDITALESYRIDIKEVEYESR